MPRDVPSSPPITILNVDDHQDGRELLTEILRAEGFAVIEADSGATALARAVPAPDLVILDLMLPDLNGTEVCRRLKSRPETASTPVLMISAVFTTVQDRSGGLDSGADAYLTKPYHERELLATIRSLLRARRSERVVRRRERAMHEFQDELAAALLAPTLALDDALKRIGELARSVLDVDVVRVRILERAGALRLTASIGETRCAEPEGAAVAVFPRAVLRKRVTLDVADAQGDPAFEAPGRLAAEGVASAFGVPMLLDDDPVGVLTCWSRRPRAWSVDDVAHLETIARQGSVAIRNARLYEASERQRRSAEKLAHIGRLLSESLRIEVISQVIADSVLELVGSVSAMVYRLDAHGDGHVVATAGGLALGSGVAVPRGAGLLGLALRTGQPAVTADLLDDPRISLTPELITHCRRAGYRAGLALPIITRGTAIGGLVVVHATTRSFDAADVDLLRTFAGQATIALENARLYEESEERRRSAEALVEIGRALGPTLELKEILTIVAQRATQAFGAARCTVALLEDGAFVSAMVWRADVHDDDTRRKLADATVRVHPDDVPLLAEVLRRRAPVIVEDATTSPLLPAWWTKRFGTRAGLVVPLLRRDDVFGVLSVGVTDGRRVWKPAEVELATAIAGQAALAITNAQLFTAEQASREAAQEAARALKDEVIERMRAETMLALEKDLLAMVAAQTSLPTVLDALCRAVEELSDGVRASVLILDADGTRLRHGAAPNLPRAYVDAIDGFAIGPQAESCGAVAYRRAPVIVTDIAADSSWDDFRSLALGQGLRACWSMLIVSGAGAVLGALAVYSTVPGAPTDGDLELMDRATHLAGIAIERERADEATKRAAAQLSESEARYRVLVSNMPGVAWAADRYGNAVYISPRADRLFGLTRDEIYRGGRAFWLDRIHPDDVDAVRRSYDALFTDGTPFDVEGRLRRADARWIWLRARAELITVPTGGALAYGVFEDVTERRQAERIRELFVNQVITAQEDERRRIARELHDDTAQAIVSMQIGLDRLVGARSLPKVREEAHLLRAMAAHALREVRRLSAGLRPRSLDDLGLPVSLERYAADFGAARELAITVDVARAGADRLPADIESALYRIAQETLANVARHAKASGASIVLERSAGSVRLSVEDTGSGFDVAAALADVGGGHFGLHNIRERAAVLGGHAEISSVPGRGTRVTVEIPLANPPR